LQHYLFIFSLIVTCLLAGCSSAPSHIILSPQITFKATPSYTNQTVSVEIKDLRTNNHIVQVLQADKAAQLFSPSIPLANAITEHLTRFLNQQGLNTTGGNTVVAIQIDKAIVSVEQALMKYQANSEIQLTISVNKGDKTLTQVIKSKGNSNGPLKADIAVLERDLNQQLGKVITDIATNLELIEFIKG